MKSWILIATVAAALASASAAFAAPSIHAGAWETKIGDGPARRVCQPVDRTFDKETIAKMMAATGVHCSMSDIQYAGPVTSYTSTCEIGGGKLVTFATMTAIGPDTYSNHSKSHYSGGSIKIPDQDMTLISRRVGPCLPSDRRSPW